MRLAEIIWLERRGIRETGYKRIVHIRVTTDALIGAPVTVPVTPERARILGRLLAVSDDSVLPDQRDVEEMMELLIHPEDWAELLIETDANGAYIVDTVGEVRRVWGIPVSE